MRRYNHEGKNNAGSIDSAEKNVGRQQLGCYCGIVIRSQPTKSAVTAKYHITFLGTNNTKGDKHHFFILVGSLYMPLQLSRRDRNQATIHTFNLIVPAISAESIYLIFEQSFNLTHSPTTSYLVLCFLLLNKSIETSAYKRHDVNKQRLRQARPSSRPSVPSRFRPCPKCGSIALVSRSERLSIELTSDSRSFFN